MSNLRQAAQRALKAMEDGEDRADMIEFSDALIALRAALAEPEQEQEPVAWMVYALDGRSVCVTDNPADFTDGHRALPLFTTPLQSATPMTDAEILSVLMLNPPEPSLWPHLKDEAVVGDVQMAVLAIARAVIAAYEAKQGDSNE